MGSNGRTVGPRAAGLLAVTAATGVVLALHGWSGRHSGLAPGALATSSGPPALAGPTASAGPAGSVGPTGPASPTPAPGPSRASPGPQPGPLLRSEPFAAYSYLVWPGTPTAAAQAALAGLSVSVHRDGAGISVTAGVNGQPAAAPRFYPRGARVYVVEASLGDDSGNSDYNLGDDGLVVTDAQQRVLP
jgi:hypothetical protein